MMDSPVDKGGPRNVITLLQWLLLLDLTPDSSQNRYQQSESLQVSERGQSSISQHWATQKGFRRIAVVNSYPNRHADLIAKISKYAGGLRSWKLPWCKYAQAKQW